VIEKILVFTDGAANPNPGHAGIGIVIFDEEGNELCRHGDYIGEHTNNEAEYTALIRALDLAPAHCTLHVVCHSDSELVVRQLNHIYRVKKPSLLELHRQVRHRESTFLSVEYVHVPREHPRLQIADDLSNRAIGTRGRVT